MKLFTLYSPPEHAAGTAEKVKTDVRDETPAAPIG